MSAGEPMELQPGRVHVWWARIGAVLADVTGSRLFSILDSSERDRYTRLHSEKDRIIYLCSHVLLRVLCSRYCGGPPESCCFEVDEFGRPFLRDRAAAWPDISLSHTAGLAACAFTRAGRVGVDVEWVSRRSEWEELTARVLDVSELSEIHSWPLDRRRGRFFEYWTIKEALAKAWGTGIRTDFRDLVIRFIDGAPHVLHVPSGLPAPRALHLEALVDHRLAVALVDGGGQSSVQSTPGFEVMRFWESWDDLASVVLTQ